MRAQYIITVEVPDGMTEDEMSDVIQDGFEMRGDQLSGVLSCTKLKSIEAKGIPVKDLEGLIP